MPSFSKLGKLLTLALCCVLLVFMTVEVAHAHSGSATDPAHCPLCVAAHVALHSAVTVAASLFLASMGALADPAACAGFSVFRAARRIRPPPARTLAPIV